MLQIAILILGIIALVKGKLAVTKHKELRGTPLYVAAGLLIIPLPLSFLVGMIYGASAVASGKTIDRGDTTLILLGVLTSWVPVIAAIVIGFVMGQPKLDTKAPASHGFEVQPMQPGVGYPQQGYPQQGYPQQPVPPTGGQPPYPPQ